MKMSVVYHTVSGTTRAAAELIVEGMEKVAGVEARAFSIDDVDFDWVKESSCVVIGTPVYMASFTAAIKTWLETAAFKCNMAGKIGGAFATANYVHGGGELAIRTILDHLMCYGMLAYSGGSAYGVPVIHLGPVALKEKFDDSADTFKLYGERMAKKTLEVFNNR